MFPCSLKDGNPIVAAGSQVLNLHTLGEVIYRAPRQRVLAI